MKICRLSSFIIQFLKRTLLVFAALTLWSIAYAVPIVSMTTTDTTVSIQPGTTTTATYTVVNTSGINLTGVEFYAPPLSRVTGGTCTTTLLVGASCTVVLTIGPSDREGMIQLEPLGMCGEHRKVCASANAHNRITVRIGGTVLAYSGLASFSVSVIDTGTNAVLTTVGTTSIPFSMAFLLNGTRAYIGTIASFIDVVDTKTSTVVATIPTTKGFLASIAMTPDGTRAYVVIRTPFPGPDINVIDTATNTVVDTISITPGSNNDASIAISPDGTRAYFGEDSTLYVIDTATNAVVDTVVVGVISLGAEHAVAVTPDGTRVYVGINTSAVVVVDTATNTVVATVPLSVVGAATHNIAITPDGTQAYVTELTGVSVIDIATNTVVTTIATSNSILKGIAITPDGTRAYVNGSTTTLVSVIDIATNTVVATINQGSNATLSTIAITPVAVPFPIT